MQSNVRRCWQLAAIGCAAIGIVQNSAAAATLSEPILYAPASPCDIERAGYPQCVSPLAKCAKRCAYTGYYVGGGAPSNANFRCHEQGTWGWDYIGDRWNPLVRLGFTHPPRYQGGTGQYEPDGPKCKE